MQTKRLFISLLVCIALLKLTFLVVNNVFLLTKVKLTSDLVCMAPLARVFAECYYVRLWLSGMAPLVRVLGGGAVVRTPP